MNNEKKEYNIIIAGDLIPVKDNFDLFSSGNIEDLYGERISNLFKRADYSIVNLEGALTDCKDRPEKSGPYIVAPPTTIKGIKDLGIKAAALANNHSTDAGHQGCLDTIRVLENAGIDYVGVGTQDDMKKYLSLQFGDKKVCIYNVSETFIYNLPGKETLGAHLYDEYLVCNEIRLLKQTHDYVFVIFHSGSEYFRFPTPVVSRCCHRMIDSGADLITTQHTHCVGCEEHYKGGYILHGQGNFCFGNHRNKERQKITNQGIVLEIIISEEGLRINKHLSSIYNNRYIRYDDAQDFSSFNERSQRVAAGEDFSEELQKCKFEGIFHIYLSAYKGHVPFLKFIKKHFPKVYQRYMYSSYTRRQTLIILASLMSNRRNEELTLIWKNIHDNFAK